MACGDRPCTARVTNTVTGTPMPLPIKYSKTLPNQSYHPQAKRRASAQAMSAVAPCRKQKDRKTKQEQYASAKANPPKMR